MVAYEQNQKNFLVYDLITKKLVSKIPQVESIPIIVTKMALSNNKLLYILGKNLVC
jgi:hypothetical protein